VVTPVHSAVDQHQVSLRTALSSDPPPVLADRVQVQQVLLNLLMNGIEAMDPVTDRPRERTVVGHPERRSRHNVSVQPAHRR
jgi:C4-dicarboxylate-specific signal transduction histidine kinase